MQNGEIAASGSLVDDILNGAYKEEEDIGMPIDTDDILGGHDEATLGNMDNLLDD